MYYDSVDDNGFKRTINCTPFWQSPGKFIDISPLNFTSAESKDYIRIDNIQTAAYIGMGLNIAMVILFLFTFKGKFKKLYKVHYTSVKWKCITLPTFFMRWFYVLFPFFEALSPLSDSILGKRRSRTIGPYVSQHSRVDVGKVCLANYRY